MLNTTKGNMYKFVTHTWNPIKGKCSHDCSYCYMKIWKQKPLHLVEKELQDDLGSGNFIFVGSSTDMFADDVPDGWITKVLQCANSFKQNQYLFQTKNPKKMGRFVDLIPPNSILGITLETNREECLGNAPKRAERIKEFKQIEWNSKMVSIEPIMDFDLDIFVDWLKDLPLKFISIGADSKNHKLPEPSKEKVQLLINELGKRYQLILKNNLKRIYPLEEKI